MIDASLLAVLPLSLRIEVEENVSRKDFTQSELARIQRALIDYVAADRKRNQGARTDLTSTQSSVQVPRTRVPNSTEVVAGMFGESEATVRKRLAILDAAENYPERFGMLIKDMDRTKQVDGVYRRLSNHLQADIISNEPPPLPTGPFRVIVADPPWHFPIREDDPSHRGACPYPPMSTEDICGLPVPALAHDDCILWLWTTNVHLLEGAARQVLDAWGFTPKTIVTWGKTNFGTGTWLRGQTEHVVLAARGQPLKTLTNQSTWFQAPRTEHSRKPDEFYLIVEKLCPAPAGGRLEMFARQLRQGWTCWGSDIARGEAKAVVNR